VARTVVVQDKTPPVITPVGSNPMATFLNQPSTIPVPWRWMPAAEVSPSAATAT